MANNFKVFAESTTNIYNDADFGTNQERLNGVQPNTPASSQLMNSVLREVCLATTALINICSNTSTTSKTVGPNSSLTNVVNYINTGLAYWANGIVKGKIQSTPSTLNGDTITLTIGNASSTQTTTVTIVNAKHALNADTSSNVSTYINNKAISNIFETDGLTVKKATYATSATTSNHATSATTSNHSTSAEMAEKLETNAGSSTRPVYFSNGVPVQTDTSLGVSITGNATSASKLTTSNVGTLDTPVYFSNGVPVQTSNIKTSLNGSSDFELLLLGSSGYVNLPRSITSYDTIQIIYDTSISLETENVSPITFPICARYRIGRIDNDYYVVAIGFEGLLYRAVITASNRVYIEKQANAGTTTFNKVTSGKVYYKKIY